MATQVTLAAVKTKLLLPPDDDADCDAELARLIASAEALVAAYTRYEFTAAQTHLDTFNGVRLWKRVLTQRRPILAIVSCIGRWYGDTTTQTVVSTDVVNALDGDVALSYSNWWPPHPLAQANPMLSRPSQRPFFPMVELRYTTTVAPPPVIVDAAAALVAYWFRSEARIDLTSQSFAGVSESYLTDLIPAIIKQRLDVARGGQRIYIG